MTEEQQKNSVASFAEYLKKEGICYFMIAYQPQGCLTLSMDVGDEFPNVLAFVLEKDDTGLEEAFAMALVKNAQANGRIIQINNGDINAN